MNKGPYWGVTREKPRGCYIGPGARQCYRVLMGSVMGFNWGIAGAYKDVTYY